MATILIDIIIFTVLIIVYITILYIFNPSTTDTIWDSVNLGANVSDLLNIMNIPDAICCPHYTFITESRDQYVISHYFK